MKNTELVNILTSSLASLKKEGKFARRLLWEYARPEVFYETYSQARSFVSKFVRIAMVGIFLSFFQENTVIEWVKIHWVMTLGVFVAYSLSSQLVSVFTSVARDRSRELLQLQLSNIIWQKNQSVGIGTRIGSSFRQKLRTAKRCSHYDIKSVGLWPIEAISSVLSSVILLGTLTFLNWRIGFIFVATTIIVSFIAAYMSRWVREKEKGLQEAEEKASEYSPASLSVDSTFLGTSRMLFGRAVELKTQLLWEKISFKKKALVVTSIAGSLTILAIAAQLWLARDSLFKDVSLVKLGLTISTIGMAVGSFSSTMRTLFGDQSSITDIRELQEFLEYPDSEKGKNDDTFAVSLRDSVRVVDVEFAYPYTENAPLVLRGVNLEFVPGEAVVVVGANGSGKTTLGFMLSNIHRPQKGCVEYGNSVIGEYTTRSVLEHTLVIPQSGDLYDLPLCESLFGTVNMSTVDMDRYTRAIAMSGAREVLDRLPNGIHTQIGTAFTGGTNLSGGEEQRLRLAAFFYKALNQDTRLVIADEPSRHLDPETRDRVYLELIALARDGGKMVVVISHDAELERFDRVVILEKGRVIGDHRGESITQAVSRVSKRLAGDVVS
jgi:ABC-type bacteriocin/lantibiotic exporter with double-glycine peptidase domain